MPPPRAHPIHRKVEGDPAIRNWRLQPIPWHVTYTYRGQSITPAGHKGPHHVVDEIERFLDLQDDRVTTREHVWEFCNTVWCKRHPDRCIDPRFLDRKLADAEPLPDHRKTDPSEYGPALWAGLHLFGMAGAFHADRFSAYVQHMLTILDPSNEMTGCSHCHSELATYVASHPPGEVTDAAGCASWGWKLHQNVNRKLGKRGVKWEDAAIAYAWDVDV